MLLLFTLVISSIFLLRPFTVKADVNVNINKETQIVTDLIGQYSINYTGDANFFGFYGYYENNNYNEMVKDTDFKATVDTILILGRCKTCTLTTEYFVQIGENKKYLQQLKREKNELSTREKYAHGLSPKNMSNNKMYHKYQGKSWILGQ